MLAGKSLALEWRDFVDDFGERAGVVARQDVRFHGGARVDGKAVERFDHLDVVDVVADGDDIDVFVEVLFESLDGGSLCDAARRNLDRVRHVVVDPAETAKVVVRLPFYAVIGPDVVTMVGKNPVERPRVFGVATPDTNLGAVVLAMLLQFPFAFHEDDIAEATIGAALEYLRDVFCFLVGNLEHEELGHGWAVGFVADSTVLSNQEISVSVSFRESVTERTQAAAGGDGEEVAFFAEALNCFYVHRILLLGARDV